MAQAVDGGFGLSRYRITCYHSCQRETCAERTGSGEPARLSEAMKISWRPLRWSLVPGHLQRQTVSLPRLESGIPAFIFI